MSKSLRFLIGPRSSSFPLLLSMLALGVICLTTACGSGSSTATMPANSQVTVALTSTANDQLVQFDMVLNTMTLMDKAGNTVPLISGPQGFEFIQRNGQLAPVFTTSIQQGTYISASATVGGADFLCVVNIPGYGLTSSEYAYGYTPDSQVTVSLPEPITINPSSSGLLINLDVLQSASFPSSCWDPQGGINPFSITPTFTVAPFEIVQLPTNPGNGAILDLVGEITAIGASGNSFTLAAAEAGAGSETLTVNTNGSTVYQGIGSFSSLAVGTFVDMDGAVVTGTSVLASRIAVEYPSAVDTVTGPLIFVSSAENAIFMEGVDEQGSDFQNIYVAGAQPFSFDNAVFQISGQMTNLGDLPFVPSFNGSNMVAGQNLYLSSAALGGGGYPYTELDAITLIPQTVNGTVTASTPSGSFTDYSVAFSSYDLFPNLAMQPGQTTLLNNPSDVEVYIDSNTQLLNDQPLATGGTFRFYGLVFNDNGTLRMDCTQVNDGVTGTAQSGAKTGLQNGEVREVVGKTFGSMKQTVRTITVQANKTQK
jgi:hypothetical protein